MNTPEVINVIMQELMMARPGEYLSTRHLSDRAGISRATVRKLIRDIIREGVPVGSTKDGYFLMKSRKEMQEYLNSLQRVQVALSQRIADVYYAYLKIWGDKPEACEA